MRMNSNGVRKLACFRLVMGTAFFCAPGLNAKIWAGGTTDPRLTAKLMRALGARDLVLGLGMLKAAEEGDATAWVRASALFDIGDGVATLLAAGRVPLGRWLVQLALLGGAAFAGLRMTNTVE